MVVASQRSEDHGAHSHVSEGRKHQVLIAPGSRHNIDQGAPEQRLEGSAAAAAAQVCNCGVSGIGSITVRTLTCNLLDACRDGHGL